MLQFDFRQDHILAGLWDSRIFTSAPVSLDRTTVSYELELALENGGISYIDGKEYPIRKYRFYCIKPNTVRHTRLPFKCLYIKFRTESETLKALLSSIPNCFALSNGERVHALFNELLRLYHTKDSDLMICSKFTELLYILQKESAASERKTTFIAEGAKAYIAKHLSDKLTLDSIAKEFHYSPIYFHRIFKQETGLTPLEYVVLQRIEKAKNDLRVTDESISQIANHCGFSSLAYFGSVFKEKTGFSPSTFRRTHGVSYLSDGIYPTNAE